MNTIIDTGEEIRNQSAVQKRTAAWLTRKQAKFSRKTGKICLFNLQIIRKMTILLWLQKFHVFI